VNDDGKEVWATPTEAWDAAPILQAIDFDAWAALCEMRSLYRHAVRDVDARGHLVKSIRNEGGVVKDPNCLEAARALAARSSLAGKFGLSLVDRVGMDSRSRRRRSWRLLTRCARRRAAPGRRGRQNPRKTAAGSRWTRQGPPPGANTWARRRGVAALSRLVCRRFKSAVPAVEYRS
jgi:hypothetical protein